MKRSFIAGAPVTGSDFFGRRKELAEFGYRLKHDQSVLISGESRIGKTSLLLEAARDPKAFNVHTVVSAGFWASGRQPSDIAEQLLTELAELDPNSWPDSAPKGRPLHALLSGLEAAYSSDRKVAIFFNDLDDQLRWSGGESTFSLASFLRRLLDTGNVVGAATSQQPYILDSHRAIGSPILHSVFAHLYLGPFSRAEADELLIELSTRAGHTFEAGARDFAIGLLGMVPFHLQSFGLEFFLHYKHAAQAEWAPEAYLKALHRCVIRTVQQLSIRWEQIVTRLAPERLAALAGVANGASVGTGPEFDYLLARGLLTPGESPFAGMGRLFETYVQGGCKLTPGGNKSVWVRDMANHATRAVISAAAKNFLT